MYRPLDLPRLATISRTSPAPVQFVRGNIFPYHALQGFCAIFPNGFALQNELPLFELSDKIEVTAFVVDPGLFPLPGAGVVRGNAGPAQVILLCGKTFLHYAAVEDAFDAICTVPHSAGLLTWPREITLADPEIELFLLGNRARIRRRRVWLLLCEKSRGKEHQ